MAGNAPNYAATTIGQPTLAILSMRPTVDEVEKLERDRLKQED
jgi:hypothetical protein